MGFFSQFLCYLAGLCAAVLLTVGSIVAVFQAPAILFAPPDRIQQAADVSAQSDRKSPFAPGTAGKLTGQAPERP